MAFKLLGGGSDLNTVVNDVNQNILELKNNEVTNFFKDDTGTRRVLLGKGADGFYGMKVSQPSYDVFNASDSQLIFNSNNNAFKIVSKVNQAFSYTNSSGGVASTLVTLTHNLGYIPTIQAAVDLTTNSISGGNLGVLPLPFIQMQSVSLPTLGANFFTPAAFVYLNTITATQASFVIGTQNGATLAGTLYIYILQESAN